MNRHYYSEEHDPKTSNPKQIESIIAGKNYRFNTDSGVFSRNAIDFGTKSLLEAIKVPNIEGDFLDVGCGYGPIGIVLATQNAERHVILCDINERALNLAQNNIILNQVLNTEVMKSNLFQHIKGAFALIVSNPPIRAGKAVVHALMTDAKDHLLIGGELWIVIQKKQGAPSALQHMQTTYGNCDIVQKTKGYYLLRSVKQS